MRYITEDNKIFNTVEEANEHEQKIIEERNKKNRLEKEREKRYEEVEKAWKNYKNLATKYAEDYKTDDDGRVSDMWDRLFRGLLGY